VFAFSTDDSIMSSFPLRLVEPTTIRLRRLFVIAAALGALGVAIYRVPEWLEIWSVQAVGIAIVAAVTLPVLAIWVAFRGSAGAVTRIALEVVFLACAVLAAEAVLLARSPERWSDNPVAQRIAARERALRAQGLRFDARLRSDVVRDLAAQGLDAVPGLAQSMAFNRTLAGAIAERGLVPLSNVSNANVVECNEGLGYFQFRSDEHGFNNPPGVTSGAVDVAVVGESLALGHCVLSGKSVVDLVRERHPRTANFSVAGARVLSQLATFREYVEPLQPSTVLWFVNVNFADPREEEDQPMLRKYLADPSFSQNLRERQDEVDSVVRDIVIPAILQSDQALGNELERPVPLSRLVKFREVRSLMDLGPALRRPGPPVRLPHFDRAIHLAARTVTSWGGRLIVVVLPTYALSMGQRASVARYDAVMAVLGASTLQVVDGPALFAADEDVRGLFTLRIENHPNERGHALLANEILAAIDGGLE
jgi:hypothetical protein